MSDHYVVTFENVIDAHDAALQNGGGIDGIKDEALIRSAIGRPYQEFTGFVPYPTVTDKAGCLLHALLHNHGFNDASKRTAWLVCNGFLYVEEHALILPIDYEWYDQLAVMVKEGWAVEQVTEWLAQFIINLEGMDDIIIAGDGDDL